MTPTISPVSGALPQQPAPTTMNCGTPPPPFGAAAAPSPQAQAQQATVGTSPVTTTPPATTVGGGTVQAAQGAMAVSPEQIVPVLQQLVGVLTQLVSALQQQGGVTGGGAPGGAPGQVGQCGMAGCSMDHSGTPMQGGGANGGVEAAPADPAPASAPVAGGGAGAAPAPAPAAPAPAANAGTVNPSSVKDKTGTSGLEAASLRGLEEAHKYGLPLVSGKRSGGGKSDHDHGNAIDVSTLAIGVPGSSQGTPDMLAFADHMRAEGKAGRLNVKYVILNGQIASGTSNNWEWRKYDVPDKSDAEMAALKSSNPGEYNRLMHNDHVHVSFN